MVGTAVSGLISSPSITINGSGNFVIAWEADNVDGSGRAILARQFNSQGIAQGSALQVNQYPVGDQLSPSVASDPAGNFVITWSSIGPLGDARDVYARLYQANGSAISEEWLVNTFTQSDQFAPSVAMDAAGYLTVSWTSNGQDGSGLGVYAQHFNSLGEKLGEEFRLNDHSEQSQQYASVARNRGGRTAAVWTSDGQDGFGHGVFLRTMPSNLPLTVSAGGPYDITERESLALVGAAEHPLGPSYLLTYSWDINGDGAYGDATGSNPTLTWAQLVALGIDNGPSQYNVRLRVSDGDGGEATSNAVSLSVSIANPASTIAGSHVYHKGFQFCGRWQQCPSRPGYRQATGQGGATPQTLSYNNLINTRAVSTAWYLILKICRQQR